MKLSPRHLPLAAVLCLVLTSAAWITAPAAPPRAALLVHAGAGIKPALDEAGKAFEKKTGLRVEYNYKGSACLLPDVLMSKKGDVYIPGEVYYVQQAVGRKLVQPNYRVVATMTTVIIVQAGNPKHITGLADLAKPGTQIGLGDSKAVAIGRAAKRSLEKAKLWDKIQHNLKMTGLNVTELSNAVKLKHLDAAIVWDSCAALYGPHDALTVPIEAKYRETTEVPAAVVASSKLPREARQYVDFLASPEGAKLFLKHGYGAAPKLKAAPAKAGRK